MSYLSRRDVLKSLAAMAVSPALLPARSILAAEAKTAEKAKPKADPYADGVLVDGEPAAAAADAFTIAVLPDTQNYCASHPEQYLAQTRWIVENAKARRIACVLHLGDITNSNTPKEWEVAVRAMSQLDGVVPYFIAVGNHDYLDGKRGFASRGATKFNEYFPLAKFRGQPTFGGTYDREPERMENAYYRFSAGARDFLVFALEFGPRNDVLRWAGEVAAQHKDREAILITHAYMFNDDTRYDWAKYGAKQSWSPHEYGIAKATGGDVNDGEEMWTKLVSKHENFIMTLSGHVLGDGLGRTVGRTPGGRDVPEMLVNFQMRPVGGDGWLRLLEFRPDGTVAAIDYSPTRRQRNESPQNRFTVKLSPVGK